MSTSRFLPGRRSKRSAAQKKFSAHRIARQIKTFGAWQRQAAQNLAENLVEYLTEEQPMLAHPRDVAQFVADVKRLSENLAALEKRIVRLG